MIPSLIKRKFSPCILLFLFLPLSLFFMFHFLRQHAGKLLIIISNGVCANSQRATTRTNLIGSFTFSRDISIRICIPRGKSVGLSPRSAERHEKCAASSPSPSPTLTPSLSLSLFTFLSFLASYPSFLLRTFFFLKINPKPRFRLRGPRILGGTYISSIV